MECITVYNELGEEVKIVISDYIYQVLAEDEEQTLSCTRYFQLLAKMKGERKWQN